MEYRIEHDSMGEVKVPFDAKWQAQTQRAVENFPISGLTISKPLIRAIAMIKGAAARANSEIGVLDPAIATAIVEASNQVIEGRHYGEFPVDVFQTGSGTSSNMNMNEVLSTIATSLLDGVKVKPNDHTNASQSSNDVFPSSIHLAAGMELKSTLIPALVHLAASGTQGGRICRSGKVRKNSLDGRHPCNPWPGVRRLSSGDILWRGTRRIDLG